MDQRFGQPSEHPEQSEPPGGVCQGDVPTGVLGCLAEESIITGTIGFTQLGAFLDAMFSSSSSSGTFNTVGSPSSSSGRYVLLLPAVVCCLHSS